MNRRGVLVDNLTSQIDKQLNSLADQAYAAIRENILRGHLRPGTPLSRRRLAEELGMSIVPIAEALRRLEDDRLVESRARAGTRVRIHTDDDVRELYELREALESQSALVDHTQRRVACSRQRGRGFDDPLEQGVERELRVERNARVKQRAKAV